jgi:hypothetical protein
MRQVDRAAEVFEEVRIGELADGGLQDQGWLVAVEERPVESSQVMGRHADQRRDVAHGFVRDQQQYERSPSPHEDHQPPRGGSGPG